MKNFIVLHVDLLAGLPIRFFYVASLPLTGAPNLLPSIVLERVSLGVCFLYGVKLGCMLSFLIIGRATIFLVTRPPRETCRLVDSYWSRFCLFSFDAVVSRWMMNFHCSTSLPSGTSSTPVRLTGSRISLVSVFRRSLALMESRRFIFVALLRSNTSWQIWCQR